MIQDNTPILIGVGMTVNRERELDKLKSPLQLLSEAAALAFADTGAQDRVKAAIDSTAGLRFVTDSPEARGLPFGKYSNPGLSVARGFGLDPQKNFIAPTGGNTPQFMVTDMAKRIHAGEQEMTLIVGGEGLNAIMRSLKAGQDRPEWNDHPDGPLQDYGEDRAGTTPTEAKHGLNFPVNAYPLLENAYRNALGRETGEHIQALAKLMSAFTAVAAEHPQSWFPVARSPEEIATVNSSNRWVGYPYPKYMNAVMQVEQAAAVIVTSVGKARELGIDEAKWLYLHGAADANETWFVSERRDLHRSHAINLMSRAAFNMSGWSLKDIDYFDIYSCFPVAVEIACKEIGIAEDDPRGLTVTGGLPYFGGAGNGYALLSIATMAQKLRAKPGSKGLCTANGWYLTKHAVGLYSTEPVEGDWSPVDNLAVQAEIDAIDKRDVDTHPHGAGTVETYTVIHPNGKPRTGIVIGTLADSGKRFVANVEDRDGFVDAMFEQDFCGVTGSLHATADGVSYFEPNLN